MKDKFIYIKFAIIFFFTLGMIVWTIMETAKAGVGLDDDNAFLSNYHKVDRNFNILMASNNSFNQKYNIKFKFNDEIINGLSYDDIYLSQRVIQDRKIRKNILHVGANTFTVEVQDKAGNSINSKKVNILVTKTNTHDYDVNLEFIDENSKTFQIKTIGYWNITGTVEVGDDKGYFFIKSNAKK